MQGRERAQMLRWNLVEQMRLSQVGMPKFHLAMTQSLHLPETQHHYFTEYHPILMPTPNPTLAPPHHSAPPRAISNQSTTAATSIYSVSSPQLPSVIPRNFDRIAS